MKLPNTPSNQATAASFYVLSDSLFTQCCTGTGKVIQRTTCIPEGSAMFGENVAQGLPLCSYSNVRISTAPSDLYQAIQRACSYRSHHVFISTNISTNILFFLKKKDCFIALRCTNVYINFQLKLFQIPVYMRLLT
jgi:hypothetical protein